MLVPTINLVMASGSRHIEQSSGSSRAVVYSPIAIKSSLDANGRSEIGAVVLLMMKYESVVDSGIKGVV